jgi:hypothetical protein
VPTYFDRTDMIYGSEIFWSHLPTGGSPSLGTSATARANASTLGIRSVRFQGQNIPGTLGGKQTGGASYSVANWTSSLNTIVAIGAVPAPIGLPPTGTPTWCGGTDPVVTSGAGLTATGYSFWQWLVTNSVSYTQLFECCNEPTNYGSAYGCTTVQNYFDMFWTHVPQLKAWARSQGYPEIYVGGPALSGSTNNKFNGMQSFLSLCLARYNADGNEDWIPKFVSAHFYGGGSNTGGGAYFTDSSTGVGPNCDNLRTWINANMPSQFDIKIANTECNYAIGSNPGTDYGSQSAETTYLDNYFACVTAAAPDGSQRFWMSNQFCIEASGPNQFLLNSDGSIGYPGVAFKAHAAAAPVQSGTVWTSGATTTGAVRP